MLAIKSIKIKEKEKIYVKYDHLQGTNYLIRNSKNEKLNEISFP